MITGISKKYHIIADAGYAPLVWIAPEIFHFEEEKAVAGFCRMSGATDVAYTLLTDAPWGVVKLISYEVHTLIDIAQGVLALTAAFTIPINNKRAKNMLLTMGITGLVVGALSWIGSKRKG